MAKNPAYRVQWALSRVKIREGTYLKTSGRVLGVCRQWLLTSVGPLSSAYYVKYFSILVSPIVSSGTLPYALFSWKLFRFYLRRYFRRL